MKKTLLVSLCLVLSVALVASMAVAKKGTDRYSTYKPSKALRSTVSLDQNQAILDEINQLNRAAAAGTTWLSPYPDGWQFDDPGFNPIQQGWTSHDLTDQPGDMWHVEDFLNMNTDCDPLYPYTAHVGVLEGSQSLWLGARCSASTNPFCGYAKLPGYGNNWNQAFCTPVCETVSLGATVDFLADWDSEGNYDATTIEFHDCADINPDSWITFGGGIGVWDGNNGAPQFLSMAIPDSINSVVRSTSIQIRFHFQADGAWSDEDGLNNGDGAFCLDSLNVTGSTLNEQLFEVESVGATSTSDGEWANCTPSGYGNLSVLYNALSATIVQEDPCFSNITSMWTFYTGSTANYGCGGWPSQTAIPYFNDANQYLNNEVWSPKIEIASSSGVQFNLLFDSYRDLLVNPLIFYVWHVRSIDAAGCAGTWKDRNYVYYGGQKDWIRQNQPIGDLISPTADTIQVALGAVDMCGVWCGIYGDGSCHSHAPLMDNVTLYRVEAEGPQWSARGLDRWNDTFAENGDLVSTGRVDAANDINPGTTLNITPGDSMTIQCSDPDAGIKPDANVSAAGYTGSAVYCYVACWPPKPPLSAWEATEGYWPVVDSVLANGVWWACVRMDTAYNDDSDRQNSQPDRWSVDLNDSLFVTGDTLCFYFAAENNNNVKTYWTPFTGTTSDEALAQANPDEMTILPAGGYNNGGDILYVDGMDGRGAQPFFDTAFQSMGIFHQVDRFDIRSPSSGVANRLGSRVYNVTNQLTGVYKKIIWNTGDLRLGVLGDGTNTPNGEKSPDAQVLKQFLDELTGPGVAGGLYMSGDNLAEIWDLLVTGGSAGPVALENVYMQFSLATGDHKTVGFDVSPLVIGDAGGCFFHTVADTFVAYGGCALINDFDVIEPTLLSAQEMHYANANGVGGGGAAADGAVLSQLTDNGTDTVGVVLAGFSYHYIRDDGLAGAPNFENDRSEHLHDILVWLGNSPPDPTAATPTYQNSLSQNYPNPFNPQTTIEFTLKELAPVSVKIYNVRGQLVRTLVDETRAPGVTHTVTWDGRNNTGSQVSSGVYFYKLVTKNFTQTKKMVLLK